MLKHLEESGLEIYGSNQDVMVEDGVTESIPEEGTKAPTKSFTYYTPLPAADPSLNVYRTQSPVIIDYPKITFFVGPHGMTPLHDVLPRHIVLMVQATLVMIPMIFAG